MKLVIYSPRYCYSRQEELPVSQCFGGGIGQPGPGLWDGVSEQR